MGFWKKAPPPAEDTRTEVLIDRMDTFLVEMQKVADRLVEKLEEQGGGAER